MQITSLTNRQPFQCLSQAHAEQKIPGKQKTSAGLAPMYDIHSIKIETSKPAQVVYTLSKQGTSISGTFPN